MNRKPIPLFTSKIFQSLAVALVATLSLFGCSSKAPKAAVTSLDKPIAGKDIVAVDNECFSPQFSYRGDQILYICQEKKFNSQPQLFLEDLNTGYKKQISFQDGQLKEAHFLRPDLLIYLSSSDTRKEHVPLLDTAAKATDDLEVYSFDLQNDEIERLTENKFYESALVPLKHINPLIAFVRNVAGGNKVIVKNLVNKTEKIVFQTNHAVSEISVNDSNQILIVEDTGYKKWVRLIENESKQTLWPEFKRSALSFSLDSKTGDIEYLDGTKVKSLSLKNLCESEVFSFPSPVLEFQKSPVVDNLYVFTTNTLGLRRVEKAVLPRNPTQPCKKIVRRR